MNKLAVDSLATICMTFAISAPALAGELVPAPVAGVGIGALVVLGLGYRALRKWMDR